MVDISILDTSALAEIIDQYPWFSAARATMCLRQISCSGCEGVDGALREALPYLPDADYVYTRIQTKGNPKEDFSDAQLSEVIRSAISEKPRMVIAGMDFFSKDDYDAVRNDSDSEISRIAAVDSSDNTPLQRTEEGNPTCDLVSETLAQIYADQGYPEEAADIYRKLSLQSPEKSAYFASLIDKLKN